MYNAENEEVSKVQKQANYCIVRILELPKNKGNR